MSIADAKAALDGGSVDAAFIAGEAAYQAKQQGYHMAADGEGLIKAIIAVAVREDFYEKSRDVDWPLRGSPEARWGIYEG